MDMDDEAHQEWLQYEALMKRLRPSTDELKQPLTLEDCLLMCIDDMFDAIEDAQLQRGHDHG
jgi:hypothetical protein